MKRNLFFAPVLFIFLFSCALRSNKYEQNAVDCWGKGWLPQSDPSGKMFQQGINALDNYLILKGYLGNGMPADYMNFVNDTQQIVIPENIPDYKIMQLACYGDYAGAPNVMVMANCIHDNVIAHMSELDSADALFRFGSLFEAMATAGAPDNTGFKEFYAKLTKKEFNRPLLKTMFYFLFSAGTNGNRKISFGKRTENIQFK